MSEVEKLRRLLKKSGAKLHVTWGPEAHKLSEEERAKLINDSLARSKKRRLDLNALDRPPDSGTKKVDVREWIKTI